MACALLFAAAPASAGVGASVEAGRGESVDIWGVGLRWTDLHTWHLGGSTDLGVSILGRLDHWHGTEANAPVTDLWDLSATPVLRLEPAARTGLTALAKSVSRSCAPDNVTINNLLPYRIDTDRQRFFARRMMQQKGITMEEARAEIGRSVAAGRMGTAEEFADACAFLCSAQAGFISGQNLQLDGGSYAGLI